MKNLLPHLFSILLATMATTTISAQGVIDVHSHIITPEFVSSLENEGRLMDEEFPLPKYNVENHLRWMDEAGVETSVLTLTAPQPSSAEVVRQTNETAAMIVRIAEIEVYPQYMKEYLAFANEVDRLSIEREPGVICLYPMQSAEDSCQIRILEIYASDESYQQHLKTDHFQKYKQGTLHMVKDLKLPTMKPLDPETMKLIFKKQR